MTQTEPARSTGSERALPEFDRTAASRSPRFREPVERRR